MLPSFFGVRRIFVSLIQRECNMTKFEKGKVCQLSDVIEYAEGSVVSKELIHTAAGSITLFSFEAGQGLSEHSAPFDAMVTILDGEAEILIDGVAFFPKKGETIVLPANHPHALNAKVRFKMQLTMIRG